MPKLRLLQAQIGDTVTKLLDQRETALRAGDPAAAEVARGQAEALATLASRIQFFINHDVAADLQKIADQLEQAIREQTAFGLIGAAQILAAAVRDLVGRQIPVSAPPQPTAVEAEAETAEIEPPSAVAAAIGAVTLRAKAGPKSEVVTAVITGAVTSGLDPLTVLAIVGIESSFRPTARSPLSSAAGLFQFLDGTWQGLGGAAFPGRGGRGNGHAGDAPLGEQVRLGCLFIAGNRSSLRQHLGREPSPGELYMAHQQGLGGAQAILAGLRANPSAPVTTAITAEAARNNRLDGLSLLEVAQKFETMMRTQMDYVATDLVEAGPAPAATTVPAAAPPPPADERIGARAAREAVEEMALFARRDGHVVRETEEPLESRVLHYFRLVGMPGVASGDAEPWSAAFISFCLREAGADITQLPIDRANHASYIHRAIGHRRAGNNDAPIVYFDGEEIAPRVGDLVGFSRTERVRSRTDIERLQGAHFPAHTDLVLDIGPTSATVIGGNKSNTIKTEAIRLDGNGRMVSDKYFFVLRINI